MCRRASSDRRRTGIVCVTRQSYRSPLDFSGNATVMKTPHRPQNALRTPLNTLLGTEANVRLLRVLVLDGGPVGAGELARRAGLGRTTIYPVLEALLKTGIVEFVGVGARRQSRFREGHPLGKALVDLFTAEADRVTDLAAKLGSLLKHHPLRPTDAWLETLGTPADGGVESVVMYVVADFATPPTLTSGMADA